ncbi:MAG: GntR family transcriptional regulator [Planctomycetota bacterium]|nr:GntR family transcriptional regulator [Planctomycetota bacterium]
MSTTTAEFAYQSLRQMLWSRDLVPGQMVSQARIARQLRCSTVPVVEALRRLESEGILMKQPRKIARVRVLLAAELEGLFLVRQSLEMVAGKLCARRRTESVIAELVDVEKRFQEAAAANDNALSDRLDLEFHLLIVRGAHCPLLEQELNRLLLIERTVPGSIIAPAEWEVYARSHEGIVKAIVAGDEDLTELLLKRHIQVGYKQTLERTNLVRKPARKRRKKRRDVDGNGTHEGVS